MARITKGARRFRRAKRELIWTTTLFDNVAANVAGGGSSTSLVAAVDWVRGNNFEKGAVFLGMRGWYQITYSSTSTSANPTAWLAVSKVDRDEVNQDITVAAFYNSEDILYCDGLSLGGPASLSFAGVPPSPNPAKQIEVKAKRKLDSESVIQLSFQTPTAAEDWLLSGVFRSLVQLP